MSSGEVRKGDKLRIPADDWNALRRLVREQSRPMQSGTLEVGDDNAVSWCIVWNNTSTDLARFGIIGLSRTPIAARTSSGPQVFANEEQFFNVPALVGLTPRHIQSVAWPNDHNGRFGIALEPIPAGCYGRVAYAGGIIPVQINFPDVRSCNLRYADVKDSDFTQLQAAAHGAAEIVLTEAVTLGVGTRWSWVRLGQLVQQVAVGTIAADVKGYLAADGYAAAAEVGLYCRDPSEPDGLRGLAATASGYNLGRFSTPNTNPRALLIAAGGEWLALPIYEEGIFAHLSGTASLTSGSDVSSDWSAPSVDLAELINTSSLTSSALPFRYGATYRFGWNITLEVNDDLIENISGGEPPTEAEFNAALANLMDWIGLTLPTASSGTVTYRGCSGSAPQFAMPCSGRASWKGTYAYSHLAVISEGAVLTRPKFTAQNMAFGAGDDITVSWQLTIEPAGSPWRLKV